MKRVLFFSLLTLGLSTPLMADTVDDRLAAYQAEGASDFSAERGKDMWFKNYSHAKADKPRSCTSCHTNNSRVNGKHAKTGKPIKPMARSVNPERLTDVKKVEKWFKLTANGPWAANVRRRRRATFSPTCVRFKKLMRI